MADETLRQMVQAIGPDFCPRCHVIGHGSLCVNASSDHLERRQWQAAWLSIQYEALAVEVGDSLELLGKAALDAGDRHGYEHALAALRAGDSTTCTDESCHLQNSEMEQLREEVATWRDRADQWAGRGSLSAPAKLPDLADRELDGDA